MYNQPKENAKTRELTSFETLARWYRPGSGFIIPIEFINVAKRIAMITCLGTKLLKLACRQMYLWRREFGYCVPFAVNVSPYQLLVANLVEIVGGLIKDHELLSEMLTVEITDSAAYLFNCNTAINCEQHNSPPSITKIRSDINLFAFFTKNANPELNALLFLKIFFDATKYRHHRQHRYH